MERYSELVSLPFLVLPGEAEVAERDRPLVLVSPRCLPGGRET
jgi:hypothetical protein